MENPVATAILAYAYKAYKYTTTYNSRLTKKNQNLTIVPQNFGWHSFMNLYTISKFDLGQIKAGFQKQVMHLFPATLGSHKSVLLVESDPLKS